MGGGMIPDVQVSRRVEYAARPVAVYASVRKKCSRDLSAKKRRPFVSRPRVEGGTVARGAR